MTDKQVQEQLASTASVLVLLSDAPREKVESMLPEIIMHLKTLNDAIQGRKPGQGEMRIAQ